jgi:DNA-binding response OmpR family regulator
MKKILLIEDDTRCVKQLQSMLASHGYFVEAISTGEAGLHVLRKYPFEVCLLDWNLPDLSGLEVCKRYRAEGGRTPIVFLTARNDLEDKEVGLDAGGDDYVTKQFELRELLARLRAVARRYVNFERDMLTLRDINVERKTRLAIRGEKQVRLSLTEMDLLVFLLENRGKIVNAEDLHRALWSDESKNFEDLVRSHIKLLRKRLAEIGAEDLIETVRGAGYTISSISKKN